jgi:hypothetical protein
MSASADETRLICGKCGGPLRRVGQFVPQCVACLLELASDQEQVPATSAERFDHYQIATHADGTRVELGLVMETFVAGKKYQCALLTTYDRESMHESNGILSDLVRRGAGAVDSSHVRPL